MSIAPLVPFPSQRKHTPLQNAPEAPLATFPGAHISGISGGRWHSRAPRSSYAKSGHHGHAGGKTAMPKSTICHREGVRRSSVKLGNPALLSGPTHASSHGASPRRASVSAVDEMAYLAVNMTTRLIVDFDPPNPVGLSDRKLQPRLALGSSTIVKRWLRKGDLRSLKMQIAMDRSSDANGI